MRRVGRIEQVRIEHRIVLHSSKRDPLLAEMVECGFEIVNRLRHGGIFEYASHPVSERLILQHDHRPSTRRIRNSNAPYNSGTLILCIRGLQSQKPGLSWLRLVFFCSALGKNVLSVLCRNCQSKRRVLYQAAQILLEVGRRLNLPVIALFHFNYGKQLLSKEVNSSSANNARRDSTSGSPTFIAATS